MACARAHLIERIVQVAPAGTLHGNDEMPRDERLRVLGRERVLRRTGICNRARCSDAGDRSTVPYDPSGATA
jgi:hypothetical protein